MRLGILALALGALQSVVEPPLPLLQGELGVGPGEGALVGNVLLITGAVVTPVAGNLGDRYGGRRVLIRLMAVASAGGLPAALAPNLPVLLLGQVLQGVKEGRRSRAARSRPLHSAFAVDFPTAGDRCRRRGRRGPGPSGRR